VECDASAPRFLRREVQEPSAIEVLLVSLGRLDDLYRSTPGSGKAGGSGARGLHGRGLGAEGPELNAPMLAGRRSALVHERRRLRLAEGREMRREPRSGFGDHSRLLPRGWRRSLLGFGDDWHRRLAMRDRRGPGTDVLEASVE